MAIITFKSNEIKETGQTLSVAAVASQMAIEHNYKVLLVSTNFNDKTLEECFWEVNRKTPLVDVMGKTANIAKIRSNTYEFIKNAHQYINRDNQ